MNAFRDGSRGGPTIASGWPERLTMVWWLVFGTISVYWAAGGMWLVDTAVQERGVELARRRPAWFIALVLATGLVKYAFALFAWVGGLLILVVTARLRADPGAAAHRDRTRAPA